ncbi:aldehyde oxidase GLOX1 [Arachis duranensis]|uniref:Aldehyde oxidase GLOX1 n=1 Tax=Arachis duranensis TaxID=130453 RepID=A0A6P4CNK7_ARADU|nr:aldehyde oxidase GLOX1 [Arachis duranensis]
MTCATPFQLPFLIILLVAATTTFSPLPPVEAADGGGQWQLLQKNMGIVAMHMQLLHNDHVVIFDRTDFGLSNLSLPDGRCRRNPREIVVKTDCTAHSIDYDVAANKYRALYVETDVWCSSGAVTPEGTLIQTGGFNDGDRAVRTFTPCPDCDWREDVNGLVARRWYATNHILPDGRQIVIGGRRQFNYEFYPKKDATARNTYTLPFLLQTNDPGAENNLYPFVFLNVDGNLFIFANNRAILFNYQKNTIVRTYPTIPGGEPRSYPSSGSAVLLPLRNLNKPNVEAEVLICGGAPKGSYQQALGGKFLPALDTCGRIKITDANPKWEMETMPGGRAMNDMVMLPNGNVLMMNGVSRGTAGWECGRDPVLNPYLYKTNARAGDRFELQNPSDIPRVYHSSAILLRDGRVLVAGSNPHIGYSFNNVVFPTELRMEAFSPSYLEPRFEDVRPKIIAPASQTKLKYGQKLTMRIGVATALDKNSVAVTMIAPPFTTHSYSMNQRMLVMEPNAVRDVGKMTYEVDVTTPGSAVFAPPGHYLLFVVHQDIPSHGIWVQIL